MLCHLFPTNQSSVFPKRVAGTTENSFCSTVIFCSSYPPVQAVPGLKFLNVSQVRYILSYEAICRGHHIIEAAHFQDIEWESSPGISPRYSKKIFCLVRFLTKKGWSYQQWSFLPSGRSVLAYYLIKRSISLLYVFASNSFILEGPLKAVESCHSLLDQSIWMGAKVSVYLNYNLLNKGIMTSLMTGFRSSWP